MDGQSKFVGCWRDTIVVPTIFFGMSVRPKMVRMSFTKILLENSKKKNPKKIMYACVISEWIKIVPVNWSLYSR